MNPITKSCLVAAAFAAAFAFAEAKVEVGKPAPDFTLTDITGKVHHLSDYKGKIVVLEWVNSSCPVVGAHYRAHNMQNTQAAALADGAVWLQINTSAPGGQGNLSDAQAAAWLKKMDAKNTAYLKDGTGKVARLYGAQTTPHMFIINRDGTLVYQGAIDSGDSRDIPSATNYVKAALAALKAGQPIAKPVTKSYGCSIKYPKADT